MGDFAQTDVAIRPLVSEDTAAILRAILAAGDYGVLLTDLEHRSLACNRQFGEIFGVDPTRVVEYGVEELREKVLPLIPDPDDWLARLDEIYADPLRTYEDDQVLLREPVVHIHRFSGPVLDARRELMGRLWTFRDVTVAKRNERRQSLLHDLSAFHDPDPAVVSRRVLETIAEFYQTTAILSIRQGDFLEFRGVAGPPSLLHQVKGNKLKDSYCQFALARLTPVLIQDARVDSDLAKMLPTKAGLTRCLTAPVYGTKGQPVGTICFLDAKSNEPLGDEDVHFISLLAMRLSAELAREQFIRERIAEQEEAFRKDREDLETTRQVLSAMNRCLKLIGAANLPEVLAGVAELFKGTLGYEACAALCGSESGYTGFVASRLKDAEPVTLRESESGKLARVRLEREARGFHLLPEAECPVSRKLGTPYVLALPLRVEERSFGMLLLGSTRVPALGDERHATQLDALVEQANLVLAAHLLQARLIETGEELLDTRRQLIESEKLSAVGTLAAATAHDIRNILSSLRFELAADADDPSAALAAVRDQLDRFSLLAHRLLSYARPRLLTKGPVDLDAVIQRVTTLISAHARIAGVRIDHRSRPKLPPVEGEAHQLECLFVNLFLNAIQAMEPTGGSLGIRSARRTASVVIEVTDTGKGIPADSISELFRPFSSRRAEGFGLGMFSSKRIVDDHEGTIQVASKVGSGTTFTITLPIHSGDSQEVKNGRPAAARR